MSLFYHIPIPAMLITLLTATGIIMMASLLANIIVTSLYCYKHRIKQSELFCHAPCNNPI